MRRYLSTSKSSTENSPGHTSVRNSSSSTFDRQSTNLQNRYCRSPEKVRRKDLRCSETKMAVTVLPSGTPMLNDYYGKYHSLSSGSGALCRSMKYAETWLYNPPDNRNKQIMPSGGGSLHRPNFIRFERNGEQLIATTRKRHHSRPRIPCYCDSVDNNNVIAADFRSVGKDEENSTFWICRKCNGDNTLSLSPSIPVATKIDPYDLVRQNRLAGMTVRAKSCSPKSNGNQHRREINDDHSNLLESTTNASNRTRRSILECDVNPYDLVGKNCESAIVDETCLLSEDEINFVVDKKNDSAKKKSSHRFSLREKFKSKISKTVTARSVFFDGTGESEEETNLNNNNSNNNNNNNNKLACKSVEGVSIAGRRIRIFSTIERSSNDTGKPNTTDDDDTRRVNDENYDWIRDDENEEEIDNVNFLDEAPQLSASDNSSALAVPISPPKRPPRRRASTSRLPSDRCSNISKEITVPSTTTTTTIIYEVKSILKKRRPQPLEGDNCNGRLNSNHYGNYSNDGDVKSEDNITRGNSNTNFYSETSSVAAAGNTSTAGRRKVKKQVQFKGTVQEIQDQDRKRVVTTRTRFEDESGCRNGRGKLEKTSGNSNVNNNNSNTSNIASQHTIDRTLLSRSTFNADGRTLASCDIYQGQVEVSNNDESNTGRITSPIYRPVPLVSIQQRQTSDDEEDSALKTVIGSSEHQPQRKQDDTTVATSTLTEVSSSSNAGNEQYDKATRNDGFDRDSLNENDRSVDSGSSSNETSPSHCGSTQIIENGRKVVSQSLITAEIGMLQTSLKTTAATDSNFKPYLPPRQYFPFIRKSLNDSSNYYLGGGGANSDGATRAVDESLEIIQAVPSLTKTFLKNKAAFNESSQSILKSIVLVKAPADPVDKEVVVKSNSGSPRTVVVVNGQFSSSSSDRELKKTSVQIGEIGKPDLPYSVTEHKVTISIGESPSNQRNTGRESTNFSNVNPQRQFENDQHVTSIQLKSSGCNPSKETDDDLDVGKVDLSQRVYNENRTFLNRNCLEIRQEEVVDDFSSSCSSEEDSLEDGCEGCHQSDSVDVTSSITTADDQHVINDDGLHYMSTTIDESIANYNIDLNRNGHREQLPGREVEITDEHIYEEISDVPPPLPKEPPPAKTDATCNNGDVVIPVKSIFEGASKYDILKYLAVAKERGIVPEEPEEDFVIEESSIEEEEDDEERNAELAAASNHSRINSLDLSSRVSQISDSSEELTNLFIGSGDSCSISSSDKTYKTYPDIERNDSGVGSETSKCSRSKWQHLPINGLTEEQHICEDCEQRVEIQVTDSGLIYAPLVCGKCSKKRIERREIICEIVETEQKYRGDLRILLDEFYKPMLVAGLLNPEQLSAIFLNAEELLENSVAMAEKLRDAYEIALEQGDEDLLTVNIGQIFLDVMPMLNAFESYCTKQGSAALLLSNLEKEKELLRIFLRVSQMENTVLRRMNLNSFLMVPVQRVTKYPLLLARLYKVTPEHHTVQREQLRDAQHNIELHLEHINSLTKDISNTKLWRRISIMNGRRASGDNDDSLNFKLQRIVLEVLEWSHDDVRFAMEGKLFYAQPTDGNWKRSGRNIKVVPVNAVLVTLGKPAENYNPCTEDPLLLFPRENGIRDASLLLLRGKSGRFSLQREPMFLDRCVVCCDNISDEFFEVHEIPSKESYIFKAEDNYKTQQWYKQLQYHSHGLGRWRKRRNALANIMINGMQMRT